MIGRRHIQNGLYRTAQRVTAVPHKTRPLIRAFACLAVLCCLMAGVRGETTAGAQPKSKGPTTDPLAIKPLSPDTRDAMQRTQTLVPEHLGPDTPYAVTDLFSRAMAPPEPQATHDGLHLSRGLTRRLWESRISAPDPNEEGETKAALDRLIQQVRAVRFAPKDRTPTFSAPPAPKPVAEPNEMQPMPTPMAARITEPGGTAVTQTDATFPSDVEKRLQELVQDPNHITEPLETAELLFLSNRRVEAAAFYRRALELADVKGTAAPEDRAWILFQLANCLRETDMTQAADTYTKLGTEYPDSSWSELAKAHGRLISWYQRARPHDLVRGQEP